MICLIKNFENMVILLLQAYRSFLNYTNYTLNQLIILQPFVNKLEPFLNFVNICSGSVFTKCFVAEDIGECQQNPTPCMNGGSCTNVPVGSFTCDCTGTGYTGLRCTGMENLLLSYELLLPPARRP